MIEIIIDIWSGVFKDRKNIFVFIGTLCLLSAVLFIFSKFLIFIESRPGFVINDPVLSLLHPVQLSIPIFALIYISLIFAIVSLVSHPRALFIALQAYTVMLIIRMICMALLPLDPPSTMIALSDPFVEFFGTGQMLTKDLFFSGHTATLFLLFLTARSKALKYIFLASTLLVAAGVLLQHVHYSIDVLVAPMAAYVSFRIAVKLNADRKKN